jgi:hypothetical protein
MTESSGADGTDVAGLPSGGANGAVSIPQGVCPECGLVSFGWALLQPGQQPCPHCGSNLIIAVPGRESTGS